MICPKCGAQNGDGFKFCSECAYPLKSGEPKTGVVPDTFDLDHSVEVPEKICAKTTDSSAIVDDEVDDEFVDEDCDVDIDIKDNVEKEFDFGFDDDDDDDDDIDFAKPSKPRSNHTKQTYAVPTAKRHKPAHKSSRTASDTNGTGLFIGVVVVLIVLIGALFYVYLRKEYNGSFQQFFAIQFGSSQSLNARGKVTEDVTADGEPALLITVYAKKGCLVRFEEGSTQKEATIEKNSVTFRVPQSLWISADPVEGGEIKVVPTVFVINPQMSNDIVQVEFEPIFIKVPSVMITIETPETKEIVTSSSTVEIAGRVSDITAAVYMGETQLQIDKNGYFRGVYHLETLGKTTLVIEARKQGCEVGRATLTITYTKSDINLNILNQEMRTFTDTIEIKGTMDKGATVTVSGIEIDGAVNCNSDAGTFSFVAKVPTEGLYTPKLTLTSEGVTSSVDIYIEHAPQLDPYVQSAWAFDYKWIVEHPTMAKHYSITGTVTEILQTDPFVVAKLHTSEGDIIFTYYHTTEVAANDGKKYHIYAYLDGTDTETNLPRMYCWFIYKS